MRRLLALCLLTYALTVAPAAAQRVDQLPGVARPVSRERIAAVVNDNVISTSDIEARMKLAMLSSGLPDAVDIRRRLLPQILRGLIDEQLQQQEAKRLDISVTDAEIDQALARIARDNHIDGDMRTYITEHGGSAAALAQQIRAGLAWSKVVQRELRPRVDIGDDEADTMIERMRANAGKEEYLASEIFIAVDNPGDEDQVHQFADNLVQQLKGGASFAAIARQFSQGASAATGGDIGWILEGQLPAELNRNLTGLREGEITDPIRSASGYHILALREKRIMAAAGAEDIRLGLQQAFRPIGAEDDKQSVLQESAQLRAAVADCSGLRATLAEKFPTWHWQNLGDVELAKAPSWLTDKVRDLSSGRSAEPLATDKGILVYFACDRHVTEGNIDRDAIMNAIGTEKLELQARRLLRDLRRAAYLDIRLGREPS